MFCVEIYILLWWVSHGVIHNFTAYIDVASLIKSVTLAALGAKCAAGHRILQRWMMLQMWVWEQMYSK